MKKRIIGFVCTMVIAASLTACSGKSSDLKIGQVDYAAHGTKSFTVATVVMDGDKIAKAYIDDFQFMNADSSTLVPNSDKLAEGDFATNYKDPAVGLASKRANAEAYSAHMAEAGGSTQDLITNYTAIQKYAEGKTIAELEKTINGKTPEEVVDAVSSATLVDTQGYLKAIIEAAKAAK